MKRFTAVLAFSMLAPLATLALAATAAKTPAASPATTASGGGLATAVFAGGCFWSMESAFEGKPGVKSVVSGFSGGFVKDPSYEDVSTGQTGHAESIQVTYDPRQTSFEKLLDNYWHNVDPTQANGQFYDLGAEYRLVIFYGSDAEKKIAEASKNAVGQKLKKQIYASIEPFQAFYPAENYHQDYAAKNPAHYWAYRTGSGRDARLKKIWGKAPEIAHH